MRTLYLLLAVVCLSTGHPKAAPRLALVIGNSNYTQAPALLNPENDARLMARTLRSVGFEVLPAVIDADRSAMQTAVSDFGAALRAAGPDAVGFFFFAGHGVQVDGQNFLLPVDADIRHEADVPGASLDVTNVLRQMESAGNRLNVLVLDACRNNPFKRAFRSARTGLAEINAPPGSFIAYATAPGTVASDGSGRNSPFTEALARNIPTPGAYLERIFKLVRVDVINATKGEQIPWDSSSLVSDFAFLPPAEGTPAPGPTIVAPPVVEPDPLTAPERREAALGLTERDLFKVEDDLRILCRIETDPDGILDAVSRRSICNFAAEFGLTADGYLSRDILRKLDIERRYELQASGTGIPGALDTFCVFRQIREFEACSGL